MPGLMVAKPSGSDAVPGGGEAGDNMRRLLCMGRSGEPSRTGCRSARGTYQGTADGSEASQTDQGEIWRRQSRTPWRAAVLRKGSYNTTHRDDSVRVASESANCWRFLMSQTLPNARGRAT